MFNLKSSVASAAIGAAVLVSGCAMNSDVGAHGRRLDAYDADVSRTDGWR